MVLANILSEFSDATFAVEVAQRACDLCTKVYGCVTLQNLEAERARVYAILRSGSRSEALVHVARNIYKKYHEEMGDDPRLLPFLGVFGKQ